MVNWSHTFNWNFIYKRLGMTVLAHDIEQSKDKIQDLINGICGVTVDRTLLSWNYIACSGDIRAPSILVYIINALNRDDNIRYEEDEEELLT